jgi:hypothetical protein
MIDRGDESGKSAGVAKVNRAVSGEGLRKNDENGNGNGHVSAMCEETMTTRLIWHICFTAVTGHCVNQVCPPWSPLPRKPTTPTVLLWRLLY